MKFTNKKAFTLVELVVVAVILSILATIGFISYEAYLVDARDSKRLAQLTGLRDGLRLGITKGKLPLPDDHIEIRNNTTPFLYQGYAGENVLEGISYSDATKDPYDDTYYTYLVSRNRKDFQVLGFLEKYNQSVLSHVVDTSYASIDYSQRFPQVMGKKLGILLQQDTNIPLQEIPSYELTGYMDLQDATTNEFDAYVTDTYLISGKESDLIGIIPYTTCNKIKETNGDYGNGIYNINPSGLNPVEVYCLMDTLGNDTQGGWTLIGRSVAGATIGNFGWGVSGGNIRDDSTPYSFGPDVLQMPFSEILLTTYSTAKNITRALQVDVDKSFIKDGSNYPTSTVTSTCREVYPITPWMSACDDDGEDGKTTTRNFTRYWGLIEKPDGSGFTDNKFHFRNVSGLAINANGFNRAGYIHGDGSGTESEFGDFEGEQGMIFVR